MLWAIASPAPLATVTIHLGAPTPTGSLRFEPSQLIEFTVISDTANGAAQREALTKTLGHGVLVSDANR